MKKILKSILFLLCGVCVLSACDEDRDSNPTLQEPSTFVLHTPAYPTQTLDLKHSKTLHFTWSQSEYSLSAAAKYQIQIALDKNSLFKVSGDEAQLDKTGKTKADYAMPDQVFTVCTGDVNASSIAKGIMQIAKWKESEVPAKQAIYARAISVLAGDTIYSNLVELNVAPYYIELKAADPEMWYVIGAGITGGWDNGWANVGTSMLPFFTKAGAEYDFKTGQGILEFDSYFAKDAEFKILKTPGDWSYGFGGSDDLSKLALRNGSDDVPNIKAPEDGYYKITLDTKNITCSMTKLKPTTPYALYNEMNVVCGGNSTALVAAQNRSGMENHVWKGEITLPDGGELKFKSGSTEWGSTDFPYGVTTTTGANIPTVAGTYTVYFNDLSGAFYFFKK